jgi:dTDP-4-dehydrorhamnose reductase
MEKIKRKVLVLGSTGMLGHQVFKEIIKSQNYEVFDISFRTKLRSESFICDIRDTKKLSNYIELIHPDFIINCIGVLIKESNNNPANAIYINSYFPHLIRSIADNLGIRLIHISTDCVFSGKKGEYTENDFRDADDIYGRSKALGEIFDNNHLNIRTSIIGPEIKENGEGLLHWFLNQKNKVDGFSNSYWGGVTTLECTKVIIFAIENNITGIINVTNGEKISKYQILDTINTILGNRCDVNKVDGKIVDKSLKSIRNDFNYKIPSYQIMFTEMINDMKENCKFYKYYHLNK